MKILAAKTNGRRRAFEVHTSRHDWLFPYSKAIPMPSGVNPVISVAPDPDFGNEAFTYTLASGEEGTVHIDSVREVNREPRYMAELALYKLSLEAKHKMELSGMTARDVAKAIHTSPTQLYRLLDPTNYSKSFTQLLELLNYLGVNVEFSYSPQVRVRKKPAEGLKRVRKNLRQPIKAASHL
jgi:hypothetical protein